MQRLGGGILNLGATFSRFRRYVTLGAAYAAVFKWIEDNGYIASDFPRESYIDGIWNKESEEDWLTELQVPIARERD